MAIAADGCWHWTGTINRQTGYGQTTAGGRPVYAHRLAYAVLVDDLRFGKVS